MRNLCAVVVDMQPKFTKEIEKKELCAMIDAQQEVLSFFLQRKLPLLVFELDPNSNGSTIDEIQRMYDKFSVKEKVSKSGEDGFADTNARAILKSWKATDLTFMGVHASYCVAGTVLSAIASGRTGMNTAGDLIADGANITRKLPIPDWYDQRGIYRKNHSALINYLNLLHTDSIPRVPTRSLQQV